MALEAIFEVILQPIFEVAAYWTGRILIPIFTLGRCHAEPILSEKGQMLKQKTWQRTADGKIIVSFVLSSLVGLLFWASAIVVLVIVLV